MKRFDYIVAGAGTAGCLLANRLSADPSVRVLLIEAGGRDDYLWIHIPVGYLFCIGNPRTDWLYATEHEPGLNGRSIKYPRGRVLGGCSSINGMIYMRGQRGDYDGWAAAGNPGWSWDEVLPYFTRHEDYHRLDSGGSDPMHGHGGEWRIESPRVRWEILDAFQRAAGEIGIGASDDFNRGDNFGCGYFEVNQKRGRRWNAAQAFLHPVSARSNLEILTGGQVTRLLFADDGSGRITGVEYKREGARNDSECSLAECEVILSAGAVGTPQILELSGIGAPTALEAAGIRPRVALPGVGENLQDHLQLRTVFKVRNVRTLNRQANSLFGKALMALQYLLLRRGPMTMSPSQLGAFAMSDPRETTPNIEYHVQPLSLDRFGEPLHDFPAFTASVCNLRPTSRGSIHVASPDPARAPKIRPNYLSTDADRRVAADSIRLTRRIVASDAMRVYAPEEFLPGASLEGDDALARAAGDVGTTIFHPVGTCRMGVQSDPLAVVDARLRCHRVAGLRIVDASVMPTITSGNTNSPTLMIAERGAEMILADRRRR
ncbi:MAG: GMC family oxidoreductase [Burkholderiaceae bacterium]|nr:GMC family oxidoreductase [Burkholderiaceae bacterium]